MLIMFLVFVTVMVLVWLGVNALIRLLDFLDAEDDDPYADESVSERIGH